MRLLYQHLAVQGFEAAEDPRFSLKWLLRSRSRVGVLHFHWPESYYLYGRGPVRLRPFLSRIKLALFATRLAAARLLGYRLVWTVHQVLPHESVDPPIERRGAWLLARACHLLVAHDRWTGEQARQLADGRKQIAVVPHGSYVGVYPEGRSRDEVRCELGLPTDAFAFVCLGELRAYKEIDLLLEAFSATALPDARLVIAGKAKIQSVGSAVSAAASNDARIVGLLRFVPNERVAELFHACDAAVLPRGDGGTSGSLVLALSMGLPVVAASLPTVRELTCDGAAGWLFQPHDVSSLSSALESAAADRSEARARGRCALGIARELDWDAIARELARLFDRTMRAG
jgi:beta-1,4-mannosyltransferase